MTLRGTLLLAGALSLPAGARDAIAQSQPATIPTIVAQAMTLEGSMFGRPQFFDGRAPTDWPAALIPSGAKVLGGGLIGDSAMFRMRVAVFDFSAQTNPRAVMASMVTSAGYAPPTASPSDSRAGGFMSTPDPTLVPKYCKGSTIAVFGPVDSVRAPTVFALSLVDGEAGRQSCNPRSRETIRQQFSPAVPTLSPPTGALSFGNGSSWSGTSGQMTSTLRTTMPADSLLAFYAAQLVAGGWKTDGRAAVAEGIGMQRFTFRDGQEPWTGALIVVAVGDRREVILQLAKSD